MSSASRPPSLMIVDEDTPCRGCGYNLRGLRRDTYCPECNHYIGDSLNRESLRYESRAWLERIRLAAGILLVVPAPLGVAYFCTSSEADVTETRNLVAIVLLLAAAALTGVACWLAGTPTPADRQLERRVSLRRCVRLATGGLALLAIACVVLLAMPASALSWIELWRIAALLLCAWMQLLTLALLAMRFRAIRQRQGRKLVYVSASGVADRPPRQIPFAAICLWASFALATIGNATVFFYWSDFGSPDLLIHSWLWIGCLGMFIFPLGLLALWISAMQTLQAVSAALRAGRRDG